MTKKKFRLSKAAVRDVIAIGRYTAETWGLEQCRRYLGELDSRFASLAKDPLAGRPCDEIRPGYRRFLQGRHVIFYRLSRRGIVEIVRVLHQSMLPERHL